MIIIPAQEEELLELIEKIKEQYKNKNTDKEKIEFLEEGIERIESQVLWFA